MIRLPRRPPRWWRWAVVGCAVALLSVLPALVAALPVRAPGIPPATLLAKVDASADLGYQGYAESDAALGLPSIPGAVQLAALFSGPTRMRAWVHDAATWRVDALTDVGEKDTYQDAEGVLVWDSGTRTVVATEGQPVVRFARPADLLPPALGLRLARAATPTEASLLPAQRVAGIDAAGLRLTPGNRSTTIGHADLWVDPVTGLVLKVLLVPRGATSPILSTTFLDFSRAPASVGQVRFRVPPGALLRYNQTPDLASAVDDFSPFVLPARLGPLPQRTAVGSAAGTFGTGFDVVAALALPAELSPAGDAFLAHLPVVRGAWGTATVVQTPLLNALVLDVGPASVILSGTVQVPALEREATALLDAGLGTRP